MQRLMVSVGEAPVGSRCPNCHVNLLDLTHRVYRDAIFELSYLQMSFLALAGAVGGFFIVHNLTNTVLPRWPAIVVSVAGGLVWGGIMFGFVWMMRQLSKPSRLFFRMAEWRQDRERAAARAAKQARRRRVAQLEEELRPPE